MSISARDSTKRRAQRNRTRLRKLANGRLRLSVFRSSKNIYAQVIDDERGVT
ncbi:MAG: 50S ribosomal protein L18, partial [Phenylobacterium sp.]|nr:50S ribosomal protein L18 [Phenylobacterium sp.]